MERRATPEDSRSLLTIYFVVLGELVGQSQRFLEYVLHVRLTTDLLSHKHNTELSHKHNTERNHKHIIELDQLGNRRQTTNL